MNECWHYNPAIKIRSVQLMMLSMSATAVFDWETTWKFLVRHKVRSQEQIILDESLMIAQLQILIELSHRLPKQNSKLLPCLTGEVPDKIKPSERSRLKIFSNASKCTNYNEFSAHYSPLPEYCCHTAQPGRCKLLHFRGISTSLAERNRRKITFIQEISQKTVQKRSDVHIPSLVPQLPHQHPSSILTLLVTFLSLNSYPIGHAFSDPLEIFICWSTQL